MAVEHDARGPQFAATGDEFIAAQEQEPYPPPPEMLSAFKKLFSSSFTPMSEIAAEAVSQIIRDEPDQPNPDCGMLWRTLVEAVHQLTTYNDRFVEFVVELQKLPDGNCVFEHLPQFDNHWTEFGYDMAIWNSDDDDLAAKRQAQVNEHAFMAKLAVCGVSMLETEIDRAGFVFRSTCEFAPWELVHFPKIEEWYDEEDDEEWPEFRDRELELHNIKILNTKVPLAALWLQLTGQRLYEMRGELGGEHGWQDDALNVKWTGGKGVERALRVLETEVPVDDWGDCVGEVDAAIGARLRRTHEEDRRWRSSMR